MAHSSPRPSWKPRFTTPKPSDKKSRPRVLSRAIRVELEIRMNSPVQSPLHEALQHEHPRANWGEACGMSVPLCLADPTKETELAKTLALADASFLARVVVKGPQAATYLQSLGISIPE